MNVLLILLQMFGAIMLLLYSVRMVRTGMERAWGSGLRRTVANPGRGRVASAIVGVVVAVSLQSSTAAAVLAAGFATSGLIQVSAGLALLLGADLGSALVVQFLSFKLGWLIPVLLAAGGWLFLRFESRTVKQTGRILLGIAFILLSLRMIGEATVPLKESPFMPVLAGYLADDYLTAFLAGALVTFLIHSSVAAILMIAAFTAQGVLPLDASLSLLFGANLGAGLIAVWLTRGYDRKARLLPLGNLIFRAAGAVLALVIVRFVELPLSDLGATPGRQLVNVHLLFNLALAVVCLPFVGLMVTLVGRLLPEESTRDPQQLMRPESALDRRVIKNPGLAMASATREVLRMSELVEVMIRPIMDFFENDRRDEIKRIRQLDQQVNEAHTNIKLYIAEVNRGELSSQDAERGIELTSFAINLERAGDIVAKNLLDLVIEKHRKKMRFSTAGWKELTDLHDRVMANMQLALNVLISEDIDSARQLIIEKDRMRRLERESHERHLVRLKAGQEESIETSDIHLETMRSLKEINSLFASVALPILTRSGQLLETRLVESGS